MKGFIKVTAVSSNPGNPHVQHWVRAEEIFCIAEAPTEMARVGGASMINVRGMMGSILTVEGLDDLVGLIEHCEGKS